MANDLTIYEEELVVSIRDLIKERQFSLAEVILNMTKDTFSQYDHYKKLVARCKREATRKVKT